MVCIPKVLDHYNPSYLSSVKGTSILTKEEKNEKSKREIFKMAKTFVDAFRYIGFFASVAVWSESGFSCGQGRQLADADTLA
jgi:hypothetical protein